MEEGIPRKPVEVSPVFQASRTHIYDYTLDTFGYFQAEHYLQQIMQSLDTLAGFYTMYPECRYIATKNRIYRNIILDAHEVVLMVNG